MRELKARSKKKDAEGTMQKIYAVTSEPIVIYGSEWQRQRNMQYDYKGSDRYDMRSLRIMGEVKTTFLGKEI